MAASLGGRMGLFNIGSALTCIQSITDNLLCEDEDGARTYWQRYGDTEMTWLLAGNGRQWQWQWQWH
jgi:hypothetical protein